MSFTGIFKAKTALSLRVDSKASRENGQSYGRRSQESRKVFVFQNGIANNFGANQI